jgi:hypothetical protein
MNYYIKKILKIYKKYGLVDLIVKIILFITKKPNEIQKAKYKSTTNRLHLVLLPSFL